MGMSFSLNIELNVIATMFGLRMDLAIAIIHLK